MVASSLSSPRDSSSRSSSIARDYNSSVVADHSEFEVKTEAHLTTEPAESTSSERKPVEIPAPSAASMPDSEMVIEDHSAEERQPPPPSVEIGRAPNVGSGRRKDAMAPPAKLSERINTAKESKSNAQAQASEEDPDFYEDWSGGSRYEVDNQPWSILGWITEGFKSRLQRK